MPASDKMQADMKVHDSQRVGERRVSDTLLFQEKEAKRGLSYRMSDSCRPSKSRRNESSESEEKLQEGRFEATARLAALKTVLESTPGSEPTIHSILRLLKDVLKVDTACVSLITENDVCVEQSCGNFEEGKSMEDLGFCFWTLVPEEPETMIVENTLEDARTSHCQFVTDEPFIRFYAAAPLVTSNRHRIGTLCVVNSEPMRFGSDRAALLTNFAELVMRVMEGAVLLKYPNSPLLDGVNKRGKAAYEQAYAIVDASCPKWKILHANPAFNTLGGKAAVKDEECEENRKSAFLLDLFPDLSGRLGNSSEDSGSSQSTAFEQLPTVIVDNIRKDGFAGKLQAILQPATGNSIDPDAVVVGVPARKDADDLLTHPSELDNLYIVLLRVSQQRKPSRALPFKDLWLGTTLGTGRYAKVFRGVLRGEKIAVKIVHDLEGFLDDAGNPVEALIMQALDHPNILKLRDFKLVSRSQDKQRLWLLLEFCDRADLSAAIDKGWFRKAPLQAADPCYETILATAKELADALAHVHSKGIVHCDLSGGNILLQENPNKPHGFSTKIADFGLACWQSRREVPTEVRGTPSYLAPEVLEGEPPTQVSDVFSLGVILWELVSGRKARSGMNPFQIHYAVVTLRQGLELSEGVPPGVSDFVLSCMALDPGGRPTARELLRLIEAESDQLRKTL